MKTMGFSAHGALVCWDLTDSRLSEVQAAFAASGLDDLAPKPRGPHECLRAAMSDFKGRAKDAIVQRLKSTKHGCELVQVDRGEEKNHYVPDFSVRVNADGDLEFFNGGVSNDTINKIVDLYKHELTVATPGDVGQGIISAIRKWHGVTYGRSSGGLYWLPDEYVPDMQRLANGVEAAGLGQSCVSLATVVMDERVARDVNRAITLEVKDEASAILAEVAELKDEEAIERRKLRAEQLIVKIDRYSSYLNDPLENLRTAAEMAKQAAVQAALAAMGSAFGL